MRCAELAVERWTGGRKPAFTVNINLNKWFTLRFCLRGGDTGGVIFKDGTERPVRAALLIIMVIFFAGLALDIASLAAVLTTFVLLDRAIFPLLSGHQPERGAS